MSVERNNFRNFKAITRTAAPFWEKDHKPRFPPLRESIHDRYDVAIIGGGWVGLFAAYHMAKNGAKVILFDKGVIGGAASGHSGGLILDKSEVGVRDLMVLCKAQVASRVYRVSHEAMSEIDNVAGAEGFDSGYRNLGHITGFRSEREQSRYIKGHAQIAEWLPELYSHGVELLSPDDTGAPRFFKHGAAYAPEGGIFNPHNVVEGMLAALKKYGVKLHERTKVDAFEPASRRGVRLYAGMHSVEADRVILGGGNTSALVKSHNFPYVQPIIAAMAATEPLDKKLVDRLSNNQGQEVPVMCAGIAAPYYRFTNDGRLLFGSGGRAGENEYAEIVKDIARDMFRVFPELHKKVNPADNLIWGRMLYHSYHDLPFVFALSREGNWVPELPAAKEISVIGVAGLGGQGNNFGPYLGRMIAQTLMDENVKAYAALQLVHSLTPQKPLTVSGAKKRLAPERRL